MIAFFDWAPFWAFNLLDQLVVGVAFWALFGLVWYTVRFLNWLFVGRHEEPWDYAEHHRKELGMERDEYDALQRHINAWTPPGGGRRWISGPYGPIYLDDVNGQPLPDDQVISGQVRRGGDGVIEYKPEEPCGTCGHAYAVHAEIPGACDRFVRDYSHIPIQFIPEGDPIFTEGVIFTSPIRPTKPKPDDDKAETP